MNNTELLSKRTTLAMKYTAGVCKQYNISDRAGSKVWNAVVKDLEEAGYLKKDESRDIIEELIEDKDRRESGVSGGGSSKEKSGTRGTPGLQKGA